MKILKVIGNILMTIFHILLFIIVVLINTGTDFFKNITKRFPDLEETICEIWHGKDEVYF